VHSTVVYIVNTTLIYQALQGQVHTTYYTTTLSDGKSNAQNGNTRPQFERSFYQVFSRLIHHVIDIEHCSRSPPCTLLECPLSAP